MTGMPDFNSPAFEDAAKMLREMGLSVVAPNEDPGVKGGSWSYCMLLGLRSMLGCNAIVLLPGWQTSRGAQLEVEVAYAVGHQVFELVGKELRARV